MFKKAVIIGTLLVVSTQAYAVMRPDLWAEEGMQHRLLPTPLHQRMSEAIELVANLNIPALSHSGQIPGLPKEFRRSTAAQSPASQLDALFVEFLGQIPLHRQESYYQAYFHDENVLWDVKGYRSTDFPEEQGFHVIPARERFIIHLPAFAEDYPLFSRLLKFHALVRISQQHEYLEGHNFEELRHSRELLHLIGEMSLRMMDYQTIHTLGLAALRSDLETIPLSEVLKMQITQYYEQALKKDFVYFVGALGDLPQFDDIPPPDLIEFLQLGIERHLQQFEFLETRGVQLGHLMDQIKENVLKAHDQATDAQQQWRLMREAKARGDQAQLSALSSKHVLRFSDRDCGRLLK
ncbi:MAG: hypothetical protein H6626_00285 [Pseudobdellovibrionaceae bacterium]|nr:MAG: hypothetical protein H6626_00285 [Pseudobdellovibrionaceae bacterium]